MRFKTKAAFTHNDVIENIANAFVYNQWRSHGGLTFFLQCFYWFHCVWSRLNKQNIHQISPKKSIFVSAGVFKLDVI